MSIVFSIVGGKPQYNNIPSKRDMKMQGTVSPATTRHTYKLPKGVSYHTGSKRYVARVYRKGKQVWLGSFDTANQASDAVDKANSPIVLDQAEVSARAHQLWVDRGCIDGYADQDWQEAERQLIAEKGGF